MSFQINSTFLIMRLAILITLVSTIQGQGHTGKECKRGLCPYIKKLVPDLTSHPAMSHYIPQVHGYEPPSLCGNICADDKHCPDHQKCCPTNCGYACFDAVFVADVPALFLPHKATYHHYSPHNVHGGHQDIHHSSHHDIHHSSHHDIHHGGQHQIYHGGHYKENENY